MYTYGCEIVTLNPYCTGSIVSLMILATKRATYPINSLEY
jgi:hypothetical protein